MARGFFAELNYQAQQAEKRRRQQQAAAYRAQALAERQAEAARKRAERAFAQAARASAAEQKAAEKEAARLHVEAQLAQVAALNGDLANDYAEIDGLLAATLEVDDYVDLESMKITAVEHPAYSPGALAVPAAPLPALVYPPEPEFVHPEPLGAFAGKKKKEAALAKAQADHQERVRQWQARCQSMYKSRLDTEALRERDEAERVRHLAAVKDAYDAACRQREADAETHNQQLSELINGLAFDVEDAITEYVGIVLSNSTYPDCFPVTHAHDFDLATRELTLKVTVPEPTEVPSVKEYKYVKAKDEITSTSLTVKAQKDRYASAVWQVAVRSLHEVFEADRAGKIHSVALTVAADRIAPATGLPETIPLVVVAADRETFNAFDLSGVVPEATLAHMGAALSKSPFDYTPATAGRGVRTKGSQ